MRNTTDSLLAAGLPADAVRELRVSAMAPHANDWERAWARARARALESFIDAPPPARAELLATIRPLAREVVEEPDDWAVLRPALERQLAARQRWLGPDAPELAETMVALARLERTRGNRSRGLELDREALRIRRLAFGPQSPEVAESHLMLGRDLKRASSQVELPDVQVDSALAVRQALFGERSPEFAEALAARANLLRWHGHPLPALHDFARARDILPATPEYRSQIAGIDGDMAATEMRIPRWDRMERSAREAVAILDAIGDTTSSASAYSLSLQGLALRGLGRWSEARTILARACRLQEARRRTAPQDLAVRVEAFPLPSYVELAIVQLAMGDSSIAWETQERGLGRSWAERAWTRGELDPNHGWDGLLARIQSKLSDSSAVIGWLDPFYLPGSSINPSWIYVIRRSGPVHWVSVPVPARANPHENVVVRLYRRLAMAAEWPFRIDRLTGVADDQREVYRRRIQPAESFLRGARELIVVSPFVNYESPLEVLLDSTGRALDERFAISYSPSALHFASSPTPVREGLSRRHWSTLILLAGQSSPEGGRDLTQGGYEVRALAGRVRHPMVLTGSTASEQELHALASAKILDHMDLVHITSHGSAMEGWVNETSLSIGVARSGPPTTSKVPTNSDGRLTVAEIRDWRLQARLVTLASCNSAGTEPAHTEGLSGVGSGFLAAGARSVLVSLWPVDDHATALLMRFFYEAVFAERTRPCSISEALREARERLRSYQDASGRHPFEHPARWGSFVLLGDPG